MVIFSLELREIIIMWKKIAYIIIITGVVFSISDYFYTKKDSYNRYIEGEYCFRYKAVILPAMAPDAWFDSIENYEYISSKDLSDTKNMLLYGGEIEVYACNPHDGICTVIYGSQTVDDFPVSNLRFSGDDSEYFYGTKKLTYEEYIDYVSGLSEDQLESDLVSSRKMAGFKGVLKFAFILAGVEAFLGIVIFLLRNKDHKLLSDILLILGTVYCIFWEIVSAFVY